MWKKRLAFECEKGTATKPKALTGLERRDCFCVQTKEKIRSDGPTRECTIFPLVYVQPKHFFQIPVEVF